MRPVATASTLAMAVIAGAAATVFACAALPTLSAGGGGLATPGGAVRLTGSGWTTVHEVPIRLDSASGPVLARGYSDSAGNLAPVEVRIPTNLRPGDHALLGTAGAPSTWSRIVLRVLAPPPPPPMPTRPSYGGIGRTGDSGSGPIAALVALLLTGFLAYRVRAQRALPRFPAKPTLERR